MCVVNCHSANAASVVISVAFFRNAASLFASLAARASITLASKPSSGVARRRVARRGPRAVGRRDVEVPHPLERRPRAAHVKLRRDDQDVPPPPRDRVRRQREVRVPDRVHGRGVFQHLCPRDAAVREVRRHRRGLVQQESALRERRRLVRRRAPGEDDVGSLPLRRDVPVVLFLHEVEPGRDPRGEAAVVRHPAGDDDDGFVRFVAVAVAHGRARAAGRGRGRDERRGREVAMGAFARDLPPRHPARASALGGRRRPGRGRRRGR
eukprot:31032-Pelagococcus_subviridis.AAC.18